MAALFVSPPPDVPFSVGGRRGETALVAPARPLGGGGSSSTRAAEVAASAPCALPPRGMGVGVDRCPLLLPPPPWGGVRDPRGGGGGGGGQCPPLWLVTPPAPPSADGRCPQKYPPALGREGGGGEDAAVAPPTRVCLSGRPAGARDACSRSPCAPPCPAGPPGGSGEGGKGCLSPPRSFNIPEPLGLCPLPPSGDAWGGGGG